MSFLHVHQQSYHQSTEESQHSHKLNFLQIQNVDIKEYKKKWMLHFNSIPNYKVLEGMYYQLQQAKSSDDRMKNEEILLQCILISVQAPLSIKLSDEQWLLVSELMPTYRTPKELQEMSLQFLHQSAYNNPWTDQEDQQLLEIILSFLKQKKGNKWSKIAKELNDVSQSKFMRTPKQCRERWGNKLDPSINREEWSDQEDLYFLQLLLQHGRRWAEIAIRLSAITESKKRTEFALKHRYKKMILCSNTSCSKLIIGHKSSVSSDWNTKEANKIIAKISQLEKLIEPEKSNLYNCQPFNKQIKLNDSSRLVLIRGSCKEEIDLSKLFHLINLMNLPLLQGQV
ncbi:unnamed protein product [Paramecium primaurelia]|uniref:Myb-like DNA-binding domain containing protein n=1 Tax=Paramecium primaurelia TaxID=5886 RepID=A0A8S1KMB6_PARPR|nr:unnamed protein product [Paramecium primaurelia]